MGDRVEGDVLDKPVDPDYLSSTIAGYRYWWSDQTRVILLFYIYAFPLLSQEELSYVTSLDTLHYSSLSKRSIMFCSCQALYGSAIPWTSSSIVEDEKDGDELYTDLNVGR